MKLKGEWFEGKILRGEWIISSDFKYEGSFYKNIPYGNGKFIKKGVELEGTFNQIELAEENNFENIYKNQKIKTTSKTYLEWIPSH